MATRSTIGIRRKDGTETRIYCHCDGYIENNGAILQLAYNTAEKVEELLKLGDLSSLGYYTEPKGTEHSFDNAEPNVCVAYHRDRGEEFRQQSSSAREEFNYTFDEREGVWYVSTEEFNRGGKGMNILNIHCVTSYKTMLLLDELLGVDFWDLWMDDEFATRENIHQVFIEKAVEARKLQGGY